MCVVKRNLKFLLSIHEVNTGGDVFQEPMYTHVLLYKFYFQCLACDVQQFFVLWIGCRIFVVVHVGISLLFWSICIADSSFTSR